MINSKIKLPKLPKVNNSLIINRKYLGKMKKTNLPTSYLTYLTHLGNLGKKNLQKKLLTLSAITGLGNLGKVFCAFLFIFLFTNCKKQNETWNNTKEKEFECLEEIEFTWDSEDNLYQIQGSINPNPWENAWNVISDQRQNNIGIIHKISDTLKFETNFSLDTICTFLISGINPADYSITKINNQKFTIYIDDFFGYKESSDLFNFTIKYN